MLEDSARLISGSEINNSELQPSAVTEISNQDGQFERLEYQTAQYEFKFPTIESLLQELQLIYGIGPLTAAKLHRSGFDSIPDLMRHPRWQRAATELMNVIQARDVARLNRYGATELQLLSFYNPSELCFIDIETTGLYYMHPLFLVGILKFKDGSGLVQQLLARDYSEEKAVIRETLQELQGKVLIISFNGRSFDLPYLKGRMKYHQLAGAVAGMHLDLLHPARKNFRQVLPDCRLVTIERQLLLQERDDDLPGSQVGEYYQAFLSTGDRRFMEPILRHNASDLLAMAGLLGLLITPERKESLSVGGKPWN